MACGVPPGDDVQVDTFALGGGDSDSNFFWILDATDRKTQWIVLPPTWKLGHHATLEALRHVRRKSPFEMDVVHADNGGEILNHHVATWFGQRGKPPFPWR